MDFRHTIYALMILSLLISCTDQSKEPEVEISYQARSEKFAELLDDGVRLEKELVSRYYDQMSHAFRTEISKQEYHADLNRRYRKVISSIKNKFHSLNTDKDPQSQIEDLKESLLAAEDLPQWYINIRTESHQKLIEAAVIDR